MQGDCITLFFESQFQTRNLMGICPPKGRHPLINVNYGIKEKEFLLGVFGAAKLPKNTLKNFIPNPR
jgi:hypothetical protein